MNNLLPTKVDFRKLPIYLRLKIYQRSIHLKKEGFNTKQIKDKLLEEYKFEIRSKTIYRWITSRNVACKQLRFFKLKPSVELSYAIGVFLGDGSIYHHKKNYKYTFSIKVSDKDFAENFSKIMSKLLRFEKQYNIYKENDHTRCGIRYAVYTSNRILFEFLSKPIGYLLSYAKFYPADLIRGLFDSDGFTMVSATNRFNIGFGISSTDLEVLEFVKSLLLNRFGITSSIHITTHKGKIVRIWGKQYTANKDVYSLNSIGLSNTQKFCKFISSSLKRKQRKLEEAIYILENFHKPNQIQEWLKNYQKKGREWTKINKNNPQVIKY